MFHEKKKQMEAIRGYTASWVRINQTLLKDLLILDSFPWEPLTQFNEFDEQPKYEAASGI